MIDKILDRKDGVHYQAKKFYNDISEYGNISDNITQAMDEGENIDVIDCLCTYIIENDYNLDICDYIKNQHWI